MRQFESGATRDENQDKLRYAGFFAPRVLEFYANYMHRHRVQADGALRAPDNWKQGIPIESYLDSGVRHMMDFWMAVEEERWPEAEDLACAIMFNIQGFLHERLKQRSGSAEDTA